MLHIQVLFFPTEDGSEPEETYDPQVVYNEPYKDPPNQIHPFTRYTVKHIIPQDHMAWETQGLIADRAHERLAQLSQLASKQDFFTGLRVKKHRHFKG